MPQSKSVTIVTAMSAIVILASCQSRLVDANARQEVTISRHLPGEAPPATVVFEQYKVTTDGGIYGLRWLTSSPVSTAWKWRVQGETPWTDRPNEPANLSTIHSCVLPIWITDRTLEVLPYGLDIDGVSHDGDMQTIWVPGI